MFLHKFGKKEKTINFKTFYYDFRINFNLFKSKMKLVIIPTKAYKDNPDIKKKRVKDKNQI